MSITELTRRAMTSMALLAALFGQQAGAQPTPPAVDTILLRQTYGVGMGGTVTLKYTAHVLFRDGTITSDLREVAATPAEFNAWRQRSPKQWGKARINGEFVEVTWHGGATETWKKSFRARPADATLNLNGRYRDMGGTGNMALGGSAMVMAWSDYTFGPGRTFERAGGAGSTVSGGGGGVVTSSRRDAESGTYALGDWTILLTAHSGAKQRSWFYRFPDSDNTVGIGGGTFLKRR